MEAKHDLAEVEGLHAAEEQHDDISFTTRPASVQCNAWQRLDKQSSS